MEQEAPQLELNESKLDVLADMLNEEAEPELSANSDELTESTASENEPELTGEGEEVAEVEALNLAEFDPEQLLMIGDEHISLAELQEIYGNRTASSVIEQRQSELQKLQSELDARKESHGYVDHFDTPHKFLDTVIQKWVENGALSQDAAIRLVDAFNGLISDQLYDMKSVEAMAAQRAKESEFEKRERELSERQRVIELQQELAGLESKYGAIGDEHKQKAMQIISERHNRTGELITLTQAFEQLEKQGAFRKAPPSKARLADKLRRSGKTVENPAGVELDKRTILNNIRKG